MYLIISILVAIVKATTLATALSQKATHGHSVLGTLEAPKLPYFKTDNPLPNGYPWGTKTSNNTNPYTDPPTTGVIRTYDFTIARSNIAPDGVNKSVLLINGQFPGPIIEANWGDTIQVTVHNQISNPAEGTALHWHGILQKGTPWEDGVPSVGQCPIAPGSSFTYQFQADLYGTSWYHSHYSAQYAGGLSGPMVIHGPKNADYDIDLGPVAVSDWYHTDYFTIVENLLSNTNPDTRPASDNNLINGKMDFDCNKAKSDQTCTPNAGISIFQFTSGKTHRLRLVNSGAAGLQRFTIDNHQMTVIANDFVPVQPYTTNVVTLGVGQRTDVLVTANLAPGSAVYMRSDISKCSDAKQRQALAAIYYENADTTIRPTSSATRYDGSTCGNDPLHKTVPYYAITPASNPSTTQTIEIDFYANSSGSFLWFMNGSSFRANYNKPILLLAAQGNTSYPYDPQWNVYNFGSNSSVRLILNSKSPASHPMHLHGHNFNVLAEGTGRWDGRISNFDNPQRRDVQMLQPWGYMVLQYNTDNPGVWPLHCHIAWHVSDGLYITTVEHPDQLQSMNVPSIMQQTCTDWNSYSSTNSVDQIDSGE